MLLRELTSGLGDIFQTQIDKSLEKVDARPTDSFGANQWDMQFGQTHNADGTKKAQPTGPGGPVVDPNADPGAPSASQTGNIDQTRIVKPGKVSYGQGFANKTRNKPIKPQLMKVLQNAARNTGVNVIIFSGGQDVKGVGTRRTGSTRHDDGWAADVRVQDASGKNLSTNGADPLMNLFIMNLKKAGGKGLGAHPGYMGGTGVHVDLWGASKGAAMWGAGGKGKPPKAIQAAWAGRMPTTTAKA
tara:strand:- start:5559 stop:6290 length:732 start_codon:yes stop_codon:yes gene_type:complete